MLKLRGDVYKGRPPTIRPEDVRELRDAGLGAAAIAKKAEDRPDERLPRARGVILGRARSWGVIIILCTVAACNRQSDEPPRDKATIARLEAYGGCMDNFEAKEAAYIQRYGQKPFVYRRNNLGNADEIGCPEISDQPPLPSADELVKKFHITRGGSPDPEPNSGSGYDAGQAWVRDNAITDASECTNASSSFEEGCREAVAEAAVVEPDRAVP